MTTLYPTTSRGTGTLPVVADSDNIDHVDSSIGTELEGEPVWGRLLFTGGIDFPVLGRKDKPGNPDFPDSLTPTLIRPTSHLKFTKLFTSHSSSHCIAIDLSGQAHVFGRNANGQLGIPSSCPPGPSGEAVAAVFPPKKLDGYPALGRDGGRKVVAAATGRNHTLVINDRGEVWSAGQNNMGQCGHSNLSDLPVFKRVEGPLLKEKVVMASAGVNFSLVLTAKGRVYAFGSPEKGQLGNGRTGAYIAASKEVFHPQPEPLLVKALEKKKIVKIASGQQHSLALDADGYVYSWGFGGLGRCGHGAQVDQLLPKVIPQFTGPNAITRASNICCGATNSMVVDGQKMTYLFGKWKTSGDGSAGQPWMSPKVVQDVMGYKTHLISAGSVTLFCVADDELKDPRGEGTITIGWGQNANNGELGLGVGAPRSATKPTRINTLDGIEIVDVAAAQNTTYFLARPPAGSGIEEGEGEASEGAGSKPGSGIGSVAPAPVPVAPAGNDYFYNPFAPPSMDPATAAAAAESTLAAPSMTASTSLSAGASPAPEDVGGDAEKGRPAGRSRTDPDKWADLPKFPNAFEAEEICLVCRVDGGEEPLECDRCSEPFHLQCLDPPLDAVPLGEWFCPPCLNQPIPAPHAPIRGKSSKSKSKNAPPLPAHLAKAIPPPYNPPATTAANGRKRKAEPEPVQVHAQQPAKKGRKKA